MASLARLTGAGLVALATLSSATPTPNNAFRPSHDAARRNAYDIFNAIHSAMRQWGSSLNHNGMSSFVVTIPPGVLLHHGTRQPQGPKGPEWLAFEVEHAELLAHPRPAHTPSLLFDQQPEQQQQQPISSQHQPPKPTTDDSHGYLFSYLTTSPIPLLYLDGTSAGSTDMGTLDTQDILLRLSPNSSIWDEYPRAFDLCDIVTPWGLQGILRMEAGFEVIKCDFAQEMEMVSGKGMRRPEVDGGLESEVDVDGGRKGWMFGLVRAVGQRFGGVGAGGVRVDWGSMVSAWFWEGLDLRGSGGLPRLVGVGGKELRAIRGRVEEVVRERTGGKGTGGNNVGAVDWQGVVDMVVSRYADRLRYMAEGVHDAETMRIELNGALNTHIDYSIQDTETRSEAAIDRCSSFYTLAASPQTLEDGLILTAVETVARDICSTLFEARNLFAEDPAANDTSVARAQQIIQQLMNRLKWTKWKKCPACGLDEVCWAPLWPLGDKESHERPNCRNASMIDKECVSRESNAGPIDGNDGFYH
ncbi:uncharacterized protein C8A04DRAFT_12335 [Dichotomopilus funicola]|uniref:Uncharacterized protein n=1 Tax=Dichotomopilus funicola TaxID=1934379 RepID=A0AAN6ZMU9_9PEZI|nr:hypothetical protein C8A04DRAFT_12335 [Dichotomopilus funicola]